MGTGMPPHPEQLLLKKLDLAFKVCSNEGTQTIKELHCDTRTEVR